MKEEQVLDNKISQMLSEADFLPRAPEDLQRRTILRMSGIQKGLEAEKQLESISQAHPAREDPQQLARLAAEGIAGRILQHRAVPEEFYRAADADNLTRDGTFQKVVSGKSAAQLLSGIRDGKLAAELSKGNKELSQMTQKDLNRQQSRFKENIKPQIRSL